MIKPVNGHVLIEPVKHDSFMFSDKELYEEVGVVVSLADDCGITVPFPVGTKIFFDSWLAAKYPKNDKEDFWLVKWEDVRAIDDNVK